MINAEKSIMAPALLSSRFSVYIVGELITRLVVCGMNVTAADLVLTLSARTCYDRREARSSYPVSTEVFIFDLL